MSLGLSAAAWAGIAAAGSVGVGLYSANKASNTQEAAAQQASTDGNRQFDLSRSDQLAQLAQARTDSAPYREAGATSLAQLMKANAPGGEYSQNYERTPFEADPGYAFRQSEGERGIERAAAAGGGRYGGATLKALARFNSGLASQEYGAYDARQNAAESLFEGRKTNSYNRASNLAGLGQTANNAATQAGQTATSNIAALGAQNAANNAMYGQAAGEARASGYVGAGNAITRGISGLYNNYAQGQALQNVGRLYSGGADGYTLPNGESLGT